MTATDQYPATAMSVANWFLERSWRDTDPKKPQMDQMKLYKLVYYAHAWYVGNCGIALFPEDIEAWPHGPVVKDLYPQFKDFGRSKITDLGKRLENEDGKFVWKTPKHDGSLDAFFESVWNGYGHLTGIQLSNMTHNPGEPWTIVAESYEYNLSTKPNIPTEVIGSVFAEKVAQAQAQS